MLHVYEKQSKEIRDRLAAAFAVSEAREEMEDLLEQQLRRITWTPAMERMGSLLERFLHPCLLLSSYIIK